MREDQQLGHLVFCCNDGQRMPMLEVASSSVCALTDCRSTSACDQLLFQGVNPMLQTRSLSPSLPIPLPKQQVWTTEQPSSCANRFSTEGVVSTHRVCTRSRFASFACEKNKFATGED